MARRFGILALSLAWLGFVAPASAHYNMLLPSTPSAKKGDTVTFTYQWGHPYEHQLFDAPQPEGLTVVAPDGKPTKYGADFLEKIAVPAGDKKARAYQFRFKPEERGDYLFLLKLPPIWMEEEEEYLHDTVKVVLHVQAQKNWEGMADTKEFELLPLTRPYGLLPGMTFQTLVRQPWPEDRVREAPRLGELERAPKQLLPGLLVEVERYNAAPPKEMPADEFITRTVRADPNGVATTTLTEPGWWGVTALREGGQRAHKDKMFPVRQRTTLWVHVADKAK